MPHACRRRGAHTHPVHPVAEEAGHGGSLRWGARRKKTKEKSVLRSPRNRFLCFAVPVCCAAELFSNRGGGHTLPSVFSCLSPTRTHFLPPMAPKADKQKKAQDKAKQAARQKVSEKKKTRAKLEARVLPALPIRGAVDLGFERVAMERGGSGEAGVGGGGGELSLRDRWKQRDGPPPNLFHTSTHPSTPHPSTRSWKTRPLASRTRKRAPKSKSEVLLGGW